MKVIICGSRTWSDWKPIREYIDSLPEGTIVIHGGARGADSMAAACAKQRGLEVWEYPAKWTLFGKRAGILRNQAMLDERPVYVVAFTLNLATSRGTRDMVERARAAGVPVEVLP
jgi:hypothetical protein